MRRQLLLGLVAGCATATSPTDQLSDANRAIDGSIANHDGPAPGDASVHDGAVTAHDAPAGSCATPMTGVLAAWNLAAAAGNQASSNATMMVSGITAGPIARSAGITATAGAGSINSNGWPASAVVDTTKYYTFTIQPAAGCQLDLASLSIDGKASATGPANADVATSVDTYTQMSAVATSTPSTPALSVTDATTQIEIRVFGFNASATSGTFRIQNTLTISGSLH